MTILSISRYSLWKNHKATTHWQVSWQMDGAKPPPPGQASWAQGRTPRTGNRQAPFVWDFCLFPFRVPRVQHPPLENRKRQFFCLPLKQAIWEQQGGFLFVMVFIGNRLIFTFKKKISPALKVHLLIFSIPQHWSSIFALRISSRSSGGGLVIFILSHFLTFLDIIPGHNTFPMLPPSVSAFLICCWELWVPWKT